MEEFINRLRKNGIYISIEGENLKVNFNGDSLPQGLLEELRENKVALLTFLKRNSIKEKYREIDCVIGNGPFVLSSAQKRLWMLCQFDDASIAYNLSGSFDGNIDREAIEYALNRLIERHEILRTVFREDASGEITQVIIDPQEFRFLTEYEDMRNYDISETEITERIGEESVRVFDLEKGPLLRAHLLRIKDDRWIYTFTMHHIISDGWSMAILIRELLYYYEAKKSGNQETLPSLRIQYKDYAAWQIRQLSGENLRMHRDYWLNIFKEGIPVLDLPTDMRRPGVKTYSGSIYTKMLSPELTKELKTVTQGKESTLFMGLLALVNVLLYRYTGQSDLVIGTPVAGRDHVDLENQIGFYVNTLALRSTIDGERSFTDFLWHVREMVLGAFEHQVYPFDELVNDLKIERDLSRNALFDVAIVLNNTGVNDVLESNLGDFKVRGKNEEEHVISKFDLTFNFTETSRGLFLNLEYNNDLYYRESVEQLGNHFIQLLEQVIAKPDSPIATIDFLNDQEKEHLLNELNPTSAIFPKKTLVDLFEIQVSNNPDRVAVYCDGESISYADINALSNQFAHYLLETVQIKSEDLIGIMLDRSIDMIVVMLGILKAGCAYVPIDPTYPEERIQFMIEDSACRLLVDLNEWSKFERQRERFSTINPGLNISQDTSAYVIYTSGTTGLPKGTLIEHRNVIRLFITDNPLFSFDEKDVWTMFHSYCFDFSVWEMYGALLFGGKLIVVPKMIAKDPTSFLQLIKEQEVTVLSQTPSSFYNLIREETDKKQHDLHLRYVVFGGEALSPAQLKPWLDIYPQTQLINMYGITETTVHVTYKEIDAAAIQEGVSNIGVPIPTLKCYVLDDKLQLLPKGARGELYVAGEGLARGYLNRPELTAQRFLPNPFDEGKRIYRSGDQVRYLKNGELEYLGRADDQVKIRGFRIELGEITHALESLEGISLAVVVAKKDGDGEPMLVAYIQTIKELNATELRANLMEKIPEYMIPSHFVKVSEMPLTTNGKVDRKKLPDLTEMIRPKVAYAAPQNKLEQILSELWSEVLEIEEGKIGINSNFFEIGGNSLKAIRLTKKMNERLSRNERITVVFRFPTISDQASYLDSTAAPENSFEKIVDESVETFDTTINLFFDNDEE
jgi:amino acid adenylation domain-containing protein